ncbi:MULTISPECIES: AQJ64_40280 family protein [Actinomadura]|uniref:Amine oxidase n=1 Tax=Actinomadura miaoliensis TaxID=430685 RepID=A0ABP7WSG8_9ACTN
MRAEVEWVDVRDRVPRDGIPVAAAISGRYRSNDADEGDPYAGQEFWLVRPMYYTTLHIAEDGREYRDCFVDSDGVVRPPYGRKGTDLLTDSIEPVTHWAELPTLPGTTVHHMVGEEAKAAREHALGERDGQR